MRCGFSMRRSIPTRAPARCGAALGSLADQPLPAPFVEAGAIAQPQRTVRIHLPPVLEVRGLTTRFDHRRWFRLAGRVHAVEQVDLTVRHGQGLALVGEPVAGSRPWGAASSGWNIRRRARSG